MTAGMTKKQRKMLIRIFISALIMLGLQCLSPELFAGIDRYTFPSGGRLLRLGVYLADYLLIGHDILKKALSGIKNRQVFDENFLMAVATLGAMALAVYEDGEYVEGIAVMLFYQVGEWFQSYAVGKSRRNISALMDIRPDYANVEREGGLIQVDPEQVETGSVIVVQPGEKVPIDGQVTDGTSDLDVSALTGESLPRRVGEGDEIVSGCINMTGVLRIRTTKEFGESTVSKILDLVENASFRKSRSENFISRFARIYTPAVCYMALALAVIPPLIRVFGMGLEARWGLWLYRSLTFLVISCPCALVISIPLSFFAGIGGAGRAGILVKGSNYLEALSRTKYVVFDKTGTLTEGVFSVNGVHHNKMPEEKIIAYAALAECASSHPISKSLQKAYGKEPERFRVTEIREIGGNGVTAIVDEKKVAVGNQRLMESLNIPYRKCHHEGTVVHVAIDGEYAGHILICDGIKPSSGEAVQKLRKAGVDKMIMLTGDVRSVGESVAKTLGIDEVYSELLPAQKVEKVEELLEKKKDGTMLAFVGDGINDAPVLSRADIGIAMGAMGSDAAIEAADVVLMDDDPLKIARAVRISRKCLGIVRQNVAFAVGVKAACLVLGALGITNMWFAIFADVGVMILAVLNAVRALSVKNL